MLARSKALEALRQAVTTRPDWRPVFRQGKGEKTHAYKVPPPPIKFLDIGLQIGLRMPQDLQVRPPRDHVEHTRSMERTPFPSTFYEILCGRLVDVDPADALWCDERMWTESCQL